MWGAARLVRGVHNTQRLGHFSYELKQLEIFFNVWHFRVGFETEMASLVIGQRGTQH